MRRSDRLAEKQATKLDMEPILKKCRLDKKTSNIALLDNGTMVEMFKHLNYMQLAKSNLVSKRFSNLICTHRHSLALLLVDYIGMSDFDYDRADVKIFNISLSPEDYSEWVIHNSYSKKVPLGYQLVGKKETQYGKNYVLSADYKDPSQCSNNIKTAFFARAQLNHDNWPLFQHFVRLITDPYIYINYLKLTPGIGVSFVKLLTEAMNPDYNRLKCGALVLSSSNSANLDGNAQKLISWIKNYVHCNEFRIYHDIGSSYNEVFLDFFMNGSNCTSTIVIYHCAFSNVIVALLQKFMDLKDSDEYQMVEYIRCYSSDRAVEALKRKYAKFFIKEEKGETHTTLLFEFINDDIGKKLQIYATGNTYCESYLLLEIKNV